MDVPDDTLVTLKRYHDLADEVFGTLLDGDGIDQLSKSDATKYTTESLNGITPSGMRPHFLNLSVGAIIMLPCNLDVKSNLCNGTRFLVKKMDSKVLQCQFVCGPRQRGSVMISKINLESVMIPKIVKHVPRSTTKPM